MLATEPSAPRTAKNVNKFPAAFASRRGSHFQYSLTTAFTMPMISAWLPSMGE